MRLGVPCGPSGPSSRIMPLCVTVSHVPCGRTDPARDLVLQSVIQTVLTASTLGKHTHPVAP